MLLKNLVKFRKDKGWKQEKLAVESGVPYNTLIKIERGAVKDPQISTAMKLAKALRVSLDQLVK